MEIRELRDMAGLKRAEFARTYCIPIRTVEDWENGKGNAPQYVKDLLERAVRMDNGLPYIYRVYSIDATREGGDEWELFKSANLAKAKREAEAEYNTCDKKRYRVELRLYKEDIDDEDCTCWDYDTIEFTHDLPTEE